MDRIKNFQDTVEHRQPKDIVMDLGGCPLSSVEGQTQARLLRYLGYDAPDDAPLLFGKVRRLDERLDEERLDKSGHEDGDRGDDAADYGEARKL